MARNGRLWRLNDMIDIRRGHLVALSVLLVASACASGGAALHSILTLDVAPSVA